MGQFTDSQLKAWVKLRAPLKPITYQEGLVFEITAAGALQGRGTWSLRYRFAAKQKTIYIGAYPGMSIDDAKKRAARLRVKVDDGIDPALEKRREKTALRTANTFGQLIDDYLTIAGPRLRPKTMTDTRRHIAKDIRPTFGAFRIDDITGADVVTFMRRVAKRSHSVAHRCFQIVRVIFAHGVANLSAKRNPTEGLRVAAIIGTQRHRERIQLTADELRTVLAALPLSRRQGIRSALAVRILAATCTRKSELLKAQWQHVDLEAATWLVPAENSKSGKPFVIPLAEPVLKWFALLKTYSCGANWCLPGQRLRTHMCEGTLNAAVARIGADVRRFTPHDLRSTARSHLAALGVDIIVSERCLNHSLGGLVSIYDRHDYMTERRRALEKWANFIEMCEHPRPENVVPIRSIAA